MKALVASDDYLKSEKEEITVQYKIKLAEMDDILHQRNVELAELRQWKVKYIELEQQLKGKHEKLTEIESISKQQKETINTKFIFLEQKNKDMLQSIQSNFEQKIEKVVENFQEMLKDCEDENIELKGILQKNIEALADNTLKEKELKEELRELNMKHFQIDSHNQTLKQNEDELNEQMTNMKANYEELKSAHISIINKNTDDVDKTELENELRDHGHDLDLLMTEYDWLVGKHAYVKSQADFMKKSNEELKQKNNMQMEEIYVNKFKYEMMVKQCQERVKMNKGTQNNYDELKQKYYLLNDQYKKLKSDFESMGGATEDNVASEISTAQTDEYFNLQAQLIQHKKNLKIRKNDYTIEVQSHQFTKDKLNTYLEKSDHLKQELSNHKKNT